MAKIIDIQTLTGIVCSNNDNNFPAANSNASYDIPSTEEQEISDILNTLPGEVLQQVAFELKATDFIYEKCLRDTSIPETTLYKFVDTEILHRFYPDQFEELNPRENRNTFVKFAKGCFFKANVENIDEPGFGISVFEMDSYKQDIGNYKVTGIFLNKFDMVKNFLEIYGNSGPDPSSNEMRYIEPKRA